MGSICTENKIQVQDHSQYNSIPPSKCLLSEDSNLRPIFYLRQMNHNILHIIRSVHDRHAVFILHDITEKPGVKPPLLHLEGN